MPINDPAPVLYYALLDCAAHDDAYGTLTTAFPDVRWRSLFENTPEAHLESSAPLLIELDAESPTPGLREWLLALERQANSVSWIESHYSLPGLCAMLTNRLPCTINEDDEVVLRFYDPRILLGLPSALTAAQRSHFFAPVIHWTAWESRREQYYTIAAPAQAANAPRYAFVPMSLTEDQRERLMYYDKEALYDSIITHWEDTCPEAIEGIERPMLREIAIAATMRCSSYGIHAAADQHLFAGLMMTLSPSFDDHPAVKRCLQDSMIAPGERLSHMIATLPDLVWQQIVDSKRVDALFEQTAMASA